MANCKIEVGYEGAGWEGQLSPSQCRAFPAGDFLGQGSFAIAYEHATDPTKVVKFTIDPLDAKTSKRLVGKDIEGVVRVFDVQKLTGQAVPEADVRDERVFDPADPAAYRRERNVPIYGIVTERVKQKLTDPQYFAVNAFWNQYSDRRKYAENTDPKDFRLKDIGVNASAATRECVVALPKATKDGKARCKDSVKEVFSAVENMAHKGGVIPIDLHEGNWGVGRDNRLVILDLGVSSAKTMAPEITELAGRRERRKKGQKNMAKRKRNLGALPDGAGKAIALVAGAGLLAWLLWPKKAKAEAPKSAAPAPSPNQATPAPSAGSTTTTPAPSIPAFRDEATGVVIAGPSTKIEPASQTYTVQKNESWSNIASRTYGDFRWWPYLWDWNRGGAQFQNPDDLKVGDVIVIAPPPPYGMVFQANVFDRANKHREYWIKRKTNPRLKMPQSVYEKTPLPSM